MSRFTAYSVELIDPRGRCDRRGLLALAIIIMVLQAALALAVLASGIEPAPLIVDMVNAVFVYMAFAATAKRLHDTGRSAWWIVGGAIAVVAWSIAVAFSAVLALGPDGFDPGSFWWIVAVTVSTLPAFALLLWLHCAKGDSQANRFGPVPGRSGFARHGRSQVASTDQSMAQAI